MQVHPRGASREHPSVRNQVSKATDGPPSQSLRESAHFSWGFPNNAFILLGHPLMRKTSHIYMLDSLEEKESKESSKKGRDQEVFQPKS